MATTKPVAREYLRVSKDLSGRARSTEEQHADNQHEAQRSGWSLHPQPYCDQSVSASRFSTVTRGGFDRLTADLESGSFAGDILLLWESSRITRRVDEMEKLLKLCERGRITIYVATHHRMYDPGNHRDRRTLLEDAVDADYESGKTSSRGRRAAAASAARGEVWGRVPYGYKREYDATTGRLLGQLPDEREAPVVREICRRVKAGDALYAIATDLCRRGIPAPTGGARWDPTQVRRIATNPTYAGWRTHRIEVGPDEWEIQKTPAAWPALIPEADHWVLTALFGDPARKTRREGGVRHLLGGIAVCGVCGAACRRIKNRNTPSYACAQRFCVTRTQVPLDAYIEAIVVLRLSRPDAVELMAGPDDTEVMKAVEKVRELRARLDAFYAAASQGKLSPEGLIRVEGQLLGEIREVERRAVPRGVPSAVLELTAGDVQQRWDGLVVAQKREVIRALLVIRILPTGKGTRRFDPDKVDVRWRGADG